MMGIKMAEKTEPRTKRRHAFRNFFLSGIGLGGFIGVTMRLLNKSPLGETPSYSPASAIFIVVVGVAITIAATFFYFRRTDEHDLLANLWSLTIGWLVFAIVPPAWWFLHLGGLAGPVNFWAVYVISTFVGALAWAWLRLR